jgi:hypothetical protein
MGLETSRGSCLAVLTWGRVGSRRDGTDAFSRSKMDFRMHGHVAASLNGSRDWKRLLKGRVDNGALQPLGLIDQW